MMTTPRRRPTLDRTISTPPLSPSSEATTLTPDYPQEPSSLRIITQLTPPTSPKLVRSNTGFDNVSAAGRKSSKPSSHSQSRVQSHDGAEDSFTTLKCPFDVDIAKNHAGWPQLFGQGAWSKVYKATGRAKCLSTSSEPGVLTPPPSPETHVPLLVAVKAPLSPASRCILENEGFTLTHLNRIPNHKRFIVPFYGIISSTSSIVLEPIPLPLSDHITTCSRLRRSSDTDLVSIGPILGSISTWLNLATKLTRALSWLHNDAGVVHGDIKPGNILLSPIRSSGTTFPFQPLLIDFSSSHLLPSNTTTQYTLSALTREFTAPELLSPAVLRDPSSTATTASDVFSLAVTLIVAATGELNVYPGNVWQRQYMATQGWNVLDFVRSGDSGMRVPLGGLVETIVQPAVRRVEEGRIDASDWKDLIEKVAGDNEGFK
jgi:Protein kinase domain